MNTQTDSLSKADFNRLRALVYQEAGINLSDEKKTMLEIRIKRRLQDLNISSYSEYCGYVFNGNHGQSEVVHLIDVVTTNKTDFFREAGHFDYLISKALPELAAHHGVARNSLLWSAGCSTGEEPYTLAMVLAEYAQGRPGFRYQILATDISTAVLAKARMGIFKSEQINPVPSDLRRKYFMRSRDRGSDLVRVVPELRGAVDFRRLNLMDADLGLPEPREIIFCRNVIIYFDRTTQVRILQKLVRQLIPGGYFFAGHSESLQGMDLPLVPAAASVYRKAQ
ncbi:MAG TPA: protein-glutamate O-methyltransferase CheR [Bryobacteraceae bacterium]|nr:protein-glutamate O-methyltransferase CheR [Bryobacteraceae bacterium]